MRDQVESRSVAVLVLHKESATWKESSMNALLRHVQLKSIDVKGMRVVTNNRCVAEQIKCDNVKSVATGGFRFPNFGEVGNSDKSKNVVTDPIKLEKIGKVGKIRGMERSRRKEIAQVNHQRSRKTQS